MYLDSVPVAYLPDLRSCKVMPGGEFQCLLTGKSFLTIIFPCRIDNDLFFFRHCVPSLSGVIIGNIHIKE